MKNLLLLLLLALPFSQACTGDHHADKAVPVQLDNGQRWKANPETTSGIADMQAILAKYEGKTTDDASRKALRKELESAFQGIFTACTMTGAAHDQLHHYLLPMKSLMEQIGSPTVETSEKAAAQLKEHLAEYQTFFQ